MNEDEEIKIAGKIDINQALKDFEVKLGEQTQNIPQAPKAPDVPRMVLLVMKYLGLKEIRQAEYVLLGFVVVMIGASLFLFFGGGQKTTQGPPPGAFEMMGQIPQTPSN